MKLRIEGTDIHLEDMGADHGSSDRAIVFIHGAGGSCRIWHSQLDAFKTRWRVIGLDLPSHGLSKGEPESTIGGYARWVRLVMGGLTDVNQWIVVGHSMGGAVAMDLALSPPSGLKGLVLVGTGAKLRVMDEIFSMLKEAPEEFFASIGRWAFGSAATDQMREEALGIMRQCPPHVILTDFKACDSFDIRGELGKIRLPTMIICGEEDQLTPLRYSEYLQEHIKGARLVVITRAGHMVMVERPDPLNEALKDFASKTLS
jgi:pimeloyl-ACP methyl ester carboxylesterase